MQGLETTNNKEMVIIDQKTVAKYNGKFLDGTAIPQTVRKVMAGSLLKEKALQKNTAALFVRYDGRVYGCMLGQLVPEDAELVRDNSGQVCGIPAVAGGSGLSCVPAVAGTMCAPCVREPATGGDRCGSGAKTFLTAAEESFRKRFGDTARRVYAYEDSVIVTLQDGIEFIDIPAELHGYRVATIRIEEGDDTKLFYDREDNIPACACRKTAANDKNGGKNNAKLGI